LNCVFQLVAVRRAANSAAAHEIISVLVGFYAARMRAITRGQIFADKTVALSANNCEAENTQSQRLIAARCSGFQPYTTGS